MIETLETHIHRGVLTGSRLTDVKITLEAGKFKEKHTSGGDFRAATIRAVRQGLMCTSSILLEPYYAFVINLPDNFAGRALTDVDKMGGQAEITTITENTTTIVGKAPVSQIRNYQREITTYSKGVGNISLTFMGYDVCKNGADIAQDFGYNPEADSSNPTSSVFFAKGTGFIVPWNEVNDYMHIEVDTFKEDYTYVEKPQISLEEAERILSGITGTGKRRKWKEKKVIGERPATMTRTPRPTFEKKYLLVDGYNVIFGWKELEEVAKLNFDAARTQLLEHLCNYQGAKGYDVIVVFDAYKVKKKKKEMQKYNNIYVVFTKEAQTADHYIEKFVNDNVKNSTITVATSDGLQQIIIRSQGALLLSSRELIHDLERLNSELLEKYNSRSYDKNYLVDNLEEKQKKEIFGINSST